MTRVTSPSLQTALITAMVSFAAAAGVSAQTYNGKISKAPQGPVTILSQTYAGQLKAAPIPITVGCNKMADPDCNGSTRQAIAVCDRLSVFANQARMSDGQTTTLYSTAPTSSFLNFLMQPYSVVAKNTGSKEGVFGDMSTHPDTIKGFRQHLMNPPETRTELYGGPGHSFRRTDISDAQTACINAHNALTP